MSKEKKSGKPVAVGLAQINNSFSGQSYLPYTVGLMQAYAQHNAADAGRYAFVPLIYKRLHIDDNLDRLPWSKYGGRKRN